MQALYGMIKRDLLLASRSLSQVINPLLFYFITISLFPLAVGPDTDLLQQIAPAVIWMAALLASLLTLDNLFRSDYEDGSLELILLSPESLTLLALAKILTHWCITGLPVILLTPVAAYMFSLDTRTTLLLMLTLLLGTPILSLIGSITTALTVRIGRGNLLLAILSLPLYVPVLIFSTLAITTYQQGMDISGHLLLLAALLVFAFTLAPLASAAALRISMD